ncbi:MAG: hypothetical protein J0I20_06905 [Chloroflexi bacterium]|nr:hypothetical protein [Chloroflexota bacterium]OJV95158.1 MAG: hypothetical protein BGO39_24400 [Chloroflexi bacterium 54-19]
MSAPTFTPITQAVFNELAERKRAFEAEFAELNEQGTAAIREAESKLNALEDKLIAARLEVDRESRQFPHTSAYREAVLDAEYLAKQLGRPIALAKLEVLRAKLRRAENMRNAAIRYSYFVSSRIAEFDPPPGTSYVIGRELGTQRENYLDNATYLEQTWRAFARRLDNEVEEMADRLY